MIEVGCVILGVEWFVIDVSEQVVCLFGKVEIIFEVVCMILEIVNKINFLVLNVLIEVVCVGVVGCGFNVVVGEVKNFVV